MDLGSVLHFHYHGKIDIFNDYCHSPGGDTAATLANGTFYTICAHSPVQWSWRSLRCLSALVSVCIMLFLYKLLLAGP